MKKILVLDKGALGAWYGQAAPDGGPLRCYRLAQAGRLELLRVINDPPSWWLVSIRNFNQSPSGPDRSALEGLTTARGNGCWRFLDERLATAKFEQLASLPIFVAEHAKALKLRDEKRERIKHGKMASYAFKKPTVTVDQYLAEVLKAAGNQKSETDLCNLHNLPAPTTAIVEANN
jgi:hypothetical protein